MCVRVGVLASVTNDFHFVSFPKKLVDDFCFSDTPPFEGWGMLNRSCLATGSKVALWKRLLLSDLI